VEKRTVKGFVPTPPGIVDLMVEKLFAVRRPNPDDTLLDPGCGAGRFIEGVLRWCDRNGLQPPRILGIDSDPRRVAEAKERLAHRTEVRIVERDFLQPASESFDFIIGNPPYVPITGLTVCERDAYRRHYKTAVGRFDLYLLFFEQGLRQLAPAGRLVFITPEKFIYVQTAEPLRRQLVEAGIEEIDHLDEASFGHLVTYPVVTTVSRSPGDRCVRVKMRDGTLRLADLSTSASWLPMIRGVNSSGHQPRLADACTRISCGVATGADEVFILSGAEITDALRPFAFPTISGRRLQPNESIQPYHSMLVPYDREGRLLEERKLGALGDYLREPARLERLMKRTCVARKPWYAFHETPPMVDLLSPKILCKDIGAKPWFVVDKGGTVVPRHSVYYLVPANPSLLQEYCAYLNSAIVQEWLQANCQRAANGFLRLQSHVLKEIPLPEELAPAMQLACL
jgi:SAM-dependent methyltransferase